MRKEYRSAFKTIANTGGIWTMKEREITEIHHHSLYLILFPETPFSGYWLPKHILISILP